jgi:dTDP-4-dehydrorhamnose 3,5-epimerase
MISFPLNDIKLILNQRYRDDRGYMEINYDSTFPIQFKIVQLNQSYGKKGTLKGLHYTSDMSKLIRVISGELVEIVVDMRKDSPDFLNGYQVVLGKYDGWLYIPKGFGNCMYYNEATSVEYLFDVEFLKSEQITLDMFDKDIKFPYNSVDVLNNLDRASLIRSEKDKKGMSVQEWLSL